MRRFLVAVASLLVCGFLWIPSARGQGPAEWTTYGGNPQRTGWQKNETKINTQSVKNFQLLWSAKTDNEPKGLAGLVGPVIVSGVQTADGTKSLVVVAGSSDTAYAIDADTGKIVWQRHLPWMSSESQSAQPPRGFICENALTASPVAAPAGGAGPRQVFVLTVDGYLHTLNLATGADVGDPIKVMDHPNAKPNALNYYDGSVYTVSGQGCGGNPNSVYAANVTTRKSSSMTPAQAGIWGNGGAAIGSDGTIYLETGDGQYDAATMRLATSVLAVNPKTLKIDNYYTPSNYVWLTQRDLDMNFTPVVFPFENQELVVASGKVGLFYVLDSKTMGGADHQTPLHITPLISNTNVNFQTQGTWHAAASWQDSSGTRWFVAPYGGPTNPKVKFPISYGPTPDGGVVALKVENRNGKTVMEPAWKSGDMVTPRTPVIAGGVVFVLAGGEFTGQANDSGGGLFSAVERVERSVPAVLYAVDAQTGKELWNSGNQVTSFVHQAGMGLADGKVVFETNDGTVYCFGLQ